MQRKKYIVEIEKKLVVSAPREQVWELLLDPHVMTGAVPGMKSIDVISPTEYVALMQVKISFISAKFKLHTHIVEQREPEYLRAEGTGEDASVASSLKQTSEIFLTSTPEGGTELRIKVNVDVLGRLGTFGLSVMKTKADRMWDEFGKNLAARIDGVDSVAEEAGASQQAPAAESAMAENGSAASKAAAATGIAVPSLSSTAVTHKTCDETERKGWFARLLGRASTPAGRLERPAGTIRVEVKQSDRTVTIEWPVEAAGECKDWLRELLGHSAV